MAQRDYVSREPASARRNNTHRKKKDSPQGISKAMVTLAAAALVTLVGGLYFITHNKPGDGALLPTHAIRPGNGLPPKPEERWRYIKELENRQIGVETPVEPSAGGEVKSTTELTNEQKQLLDQMQADMRQQPTKLAEVPYNDPTQPGRQTAKQPTTSARTDTNIAPPVTYSLPRQQSVQPVPPKTAPPAASANKPDIFAPVDAPVKPKVAPKPKAEIAEIPDLPEIAVKPKAVAKPRVEAQSTLDMANLAEVPARADVATKPDVVTKPKPAPKPKMELQGLTEVPDLPETPAKPEVVVKPKVALKPKIEPQSPVEVVNLTETPAKPKAAVKPKVELQGLTEVPDLPEVTPKAKAHNDAPSMAKAANELDAKLAEAEKAKEKNQRWLVQCGSFRSGDQAESARAQLAFAGIESNITSNGGVNRVSLGPYNTRASADKSLQRVKSAGMSGCVSLAIGG